ncbi:MAG TPA: N-acetyl-gamma-glutamyl-phosphate reductase [Nevskiaceae bacterium]|nr:N-acetyl-gamma-glutamyl-phosphate reductase [Nevskiaceae bacterium]
MASPSRTAVGIVGGTGYTGVELLRLLLAHPAAEVVCLTSRKEAGQRVDAFFPSLRGHTALCFEPPELERLARCEVVFFATPHGTAMSLAPALLERGVKVIDLSADFRLRDAAEFEQWYAHTHSAPDWLAQAVYALPEVNRAAIREARLLACPGCYPTAVQLGLLPLLEQRLVDPASLIADCKSGVSGAGREARIGSLFGECADSFKAYGVAGHRHLPEIRQGLRAAAGEALGLVFVPHLTPMLRGIHATLYARLRVPVAEAQAAFEARYRDEPFVDVLPYGSTPETRSVRGSNVCRIALQQAPGSDQLVVMSVIDNLVKGAAGQAVQGFNLMQGLDERLGLGGLALSP